jgi:hypothetical protein
MDKLLEILNAYFTPDYIEALNSIRLDRLYTHATNGSIKRGSDWLISFSLRDREIYPTWQSWGGDTLMEVHGA